MSDRLPIHDLFVRPIEPVTEANVVRWIALRESDQLLRRFGEAEIIRLKPGGRTALTLRPVADEVWAVLEGTVEALWHDHRPRSSTRDARYQTTLRRPTLLLAPFGVAFGVRAVGGGALLARFATHSRADPESADDAQLGWESGE
jgi:mannose-6-phosphate isomerase-like protein (cupin superfamily)